MTEQTSHDQPGGESRFGLERIMRQARREGGRTFASEEDFLAAVDDAEGDALEARRMASLADDPFEQAQELAYQAYEATEPEVAQDLADRALALDADNCDAQTVRAFLACADVAELIGALEQAVERGEQRLGEGFLAEHLGEFWPLIETRPYQRTVRQLAEVLWSVGRRFDAVVHYENLLDLDPTDSMANATALLGCYLGMGEVQRAWDLLEDQDDAEDLVAAWGWVLVLLLTDDEAGARESLDHAMEMNPYVATWLVGLGDPAAALPVADWIQPGSEDEALICADILGEAWTRSPEVQWWLHDVLVELGLLDPPESGPRNPQGPVN